MSQSLYKSVNQLMRGWNCVEFSNRDLLLLTTAAVSYTHLREMIYLPFQKRRWEVLPAEEVSAEDAKEYSAGEKACETAESKEKPGQDYLDINVPIGYNMLAVRVKKNL